MKTNLRDRVLVLTTIFALLAAACTAGDPTPADASQTAEATPQLAETKLSAKAGFRVPVESEVSDTMMLRSIRRGRALIHSTRDSLPDHVSANLTCANCHVADGTQKDAMPLVGAYVRFPQYRGRSGRVDLIENRINDCFQRSMNGRPLDSNSDDMHDIVAYLAFLSRGLPAGIEMEGAGTPAITATNGDTIRGRQVFANSCIVCHGANGEGTVAAPPVWGPKSYNIGAGMARAMSAARFIHQVMPRDKPGTLTPQQAFDVATYINTRPRPDFAGKENDWPKGGSPPDVAYAVKSKPDK